MQRQPICSPSVAHLYPVCIPPVSHLDSIWIPPGSHLDPIWIPSGSHLDPIWIPSGSRLDPIWIPSGSRLDPVWISSGSHLPQVRRGVVKLGFAWEAAHVRLYRGERQLAVALHGLATEQGSENCAVFVQDYCRNQAGDRGGIGWGIGLG